MTIDNVFEDVRELAGDVKVSIDVFGGEGERAEAEEKYGRCSGQERELEELREIKLTRGRVIGHIEQGSEADSNEQRRSR